VRERGTGRRLVERAAPVAAETSGDLPANICVSPTPLLRMVPLPLAGEGGFYFHSAQSAASSALATFTAASLMWP
jgi:hypothetical protein